MLNNLFKPAWKSRSIEKRLKAVVLMDESSSENQQSLIQIVSTDEQQSIRLEALKKITSLIFLDEIKVKQENNPEGRQAHARLIELMTTSGLIDADQYGDLLKSHPQLAVMIASYAEIKSVRHDALKTLSGAELLQVLSESTYSDSRQLIAEKLSDIEQLEAARKLIRGKDKTAERTLKSKIDEYRQQQKQHQENLARVEKLVNEVEYLSSHDWLPEFMARVPVHYQQWESVDFDIEAQSLQRYQQARKILDERFEHQLLVEQTRKSQQQLLDELETLLKQQSEMTLIQAIQRLPESRQTLQQLNENWQQLVIKLSPEGKLAQHYQSMNSAIHSLYRYLHQAGEILQQEDITAQNEADGIHTKDQYVEHLSSQHRLLSAALKKLQWPDLYGELNLLVESAEQLNSWQQNIQSIKQERQQRLDGLHKKISSIFRFSRHGNLNRAKQLCERVEKGLVQFTGKDRMALDERYEEARKTLGEMGDWKNYATEPKYLELCEAMEQLISSKHKPDKLASEIKDLQQQWKSLGHSDVSDQYWERFKKAADKVYQPCAEYFEERHKQRQTHLQQREKLVEQLLQLHEQTDWQNDPDYKSIQTSVRTISDQFMAIKDVEYRAGQKQWKKFNKIKDEIYARLDVAYDANIAMKQGLIEQLQALAEADARDDNLAKLKSLQNRWKQIGITRRNEDQKAWKIFKKQGDIVFNKVQLLRQGKRQQTDQQLNAYRDVIKEIHQLSKTATDLAESSRQFSVLQEKYKALPELPSTLPEKLLEGIHHDFEKACDQFEASQGRMLKNQHNEQIQAVRERAKICEQLEALDTHDTHLSQSLAEQWDAIPLEDRVLSRRIDARRQAAMQNLDRDEIAAQRKMLCIRLEILQGIESPANDKAIRMQYQLDQMNKSGLGQQVDSVKEQLESMELEWLCMPGANAPRQAELNERFNRGLRVKK